MKKVKIGLLGFGNVGGGTYKILTDNREIIQQRIGASPEITRILKRNRKKKRLVEADPALLTEDPDDIIKDPDIDIVVEMLGGIEPATSFMVQALKHGTHVVSANKAAIAANYDLLTKTAAENNVEFLFEASVAGGIPVLTAITGALASNNFVEVMGILNGTTNYILTKMIHEQMTMQQALQQAQQLGYAERNPAADIEGHDTCRKICILAALAFGRHIYPENVMTVGIQDLTLEEVDKADEMGKVIKLLGVAKRNADETVDIFVRPCAIDKTHPLANIEDVFNGIMISGDAVGDVTFYGRGAGKLPTASAVCSDIIDAVKSNGTCGMLWQDCGQDFVRSFGNLKFNYLQGTNIPVID